MTDRTRPNILWIFADQLRYHALSCNGDSNLNTPHIDRLASEGRNCHAAFSQYPVCTPFRAGLLTGKHATTCGVPLHGDFLPPDSRTIAHTFNDAGYRTSYVGKWHLAGERGLHQVSEAGWAGEDYWVHPSFRGGFEDWFGFNVSNNYHRTFYCTGEKVEAQQLEGYQTDGLTNLSLNYLDNYAQDAPWFHVISYESPHPAQGGSPRFRGYPVPEPYASMFDPQDIDCRQNVPEDHQATASEQLAGYYGLIANLDDNVGRLLSWLDNSPQADNTIVMFFSDHGEMGGSHGLRNKQVPYEESIHIPLIIRYPARLAAGADYPFLFSGLDLYPTTAGLAGVPIPEQLQGCDHSANLTGHTSEPPRESVLVQWESPRFEFGDHPYRALRTLTHTYVVGRDEAFCMLFDNQADPFQLNNLFADPASRAIQQQLHQQLHEHVQAVGEAVPHYLS